MLVSCGCGCGCAYAARAAVKHSRQDGKEHMLRISSMPALACRTSVLSYAEACLIDTPALPLSTGS